jgi:hypothetical protein
MPKFDTIAFSYMIFIAAGREKFHSEIPGKDTLFVLDAPLRGR